MLRSVGSLRKELYLSAVLCDVLQSSFHSFDPLVGIFPWRGRPIKPSWNLSWRTMILQWLGSKPGISAPFMLRPTARADNYS